ncbi:MAG: hypothetical protein JNJ91_08610 [Flavobacteriales bacterium]|nr:hypothetical protein [Flavobacteriales bacterium]
MRAAIHSLLVLFLFACQRSHERAQVTAHPVSVQAYDTSAAYHMAIEDHIAAMDTVTAPLPDTVYIGRHEDFPSINLPAIIAQRFIRIIDPAEGEIDKHRERFAYLNIFATHTPENLEFFIVRFGQGLRHRSDGSEDRHLFYRVNEEGGWVLERVSR